MEELAILKIIGNHESIRVMKEVGWKRRSDAYYIEVPPSEMFQLTREETEMTVKENTVQVVK